MSRNALGIAFISPNRINWLPQRLFSQRLAAYLILRMTVAIAYYHHIATHILHVLRT